MAQVFPTGQRALQSYGKVVAAWPMCTCFSSLLLCACFCLGWISDVRDFLGHGRNIKSNEIFEIQWASSEGSLHDNIRKYNSRRNKAWENRLYDTMFVGKGSHEGSDLLTPEVFDHVDHLLAAFHNISVTTKSNKTYSTWDLCARGAMPDKPMYPKHCQDLQALKAANSSDLAALTALTMACAPSPYMPCLIAAPQQCFSEFKSTLHASYEGVDPVADIMFPKEQMMSPYAKRPSYKALGEKGMKQEVSKLRPFLRLRGCNYFTEMVTFPVEMWGGSVVWNEDKTVQKVPAMQWMFFMDGPARVSYRLSLTNPDLAVETDILEALGKHELEWQATVNSFSQWSQRLRSATLMHPKTFDDAVKESDQDPWALIGASGILMAFFVVVSSLQFGDKRQIRSQLALAGLVSVVLAGTSATGLSLMCGLKLNTIIVAILPFLALGLGVDDMFVLLSEFYRCKREAGEGCAHAEVMGVVLAQAGPGILLTSICNTIAFAFGSLLPVPAMSDFCILTSLISAFNCFVILTQFVPLMALSLKLFPRETKALDFLGFKAWLGSASTKIASLSTRHFAGPLLALWPLALGFLLVCCVSINGKDIGYSPAEGVKEGSATYDAIELFFDKFNFFPAWLCFDAVDVPVHQADMINLYHDVVNTPFGQPYFSAPFLTMLYQTVFFAGASLDKSWTHPVFAQNGVLSAESFNSQYMSFSQMGSPQEAMAFMAKHGVPPPSVMADSTGIREFTLANNGTELGFSFFPLFIANAASDQDFVDAVEQMNAAVERSPLKDKAFVHGWTFTFWSIFMDLEPILWRSIATFSAVVFSCTMIAVSLCRQSASAMEMFSSACVALVTTLVCLMIVLEIFGISMIFLKFNIFVATTVLAAEGISVEFVAHMVTKFASEQGSSQQRLVNSFRSLAPAVIQGSLSTFFGILAMAFSDFPFVVKYFFGVWTIVVVVGLINGLVFLPAFLGPIGCFLMPASLPRDSPSSVVGTGPGQPTILNSSTDNQSKEKSVNANSSV